jgi:hypothetical protein
LVELVHPDLIITREGIHEAQEVVARSGVHQEINSWEREAVLRASLIEVGKVYAHPPLTRRFLDHDYVSQPIRVMDFPDKIRIHQLVHFFSYSFVPLRGEVSFFCLTGLAAGLYSTCVR